MSADQIVSSKQDVLRNILNYEAEVSRDRLLRGRMKRHPAWYAFQDDGGHWHFGPSKYVGYSAMTPSMYLENSSSLLDGRETEPALKAWFEEVPEGTDLHAALSEAFGTFAAKLGTSANKRWRISVPKDRQRSSGRRESSAPDFKSRVVSNPAICGGRPTIKGTRVRVSDIVEMLAHGVTPDEIVADFPQVELEDVQAALHYAARMMDQAIVHAA